MILNKYLCKIVKNNLKKGYTTGVHTLFAFKSALEYFLYTNQSAISKTNKMDNDDLDVTKGCEIVVKISSSNNLTLNKTYQTPHLFHFKTNTIKIYAGIGVGVVTKKGLKIAPHYPAINPVPLNALRECFEKFVKSSRGLNLCCAVYVTGGEELAKQTANGKVGVVGGISILGTTGIVKPVSSSAYLDSIESEIKFAIANGYNKLVFTLGNLAFEYAKKSFDEAQIVEIGNFVYDSIDLADKNRVKEVFFISGIGKMTKVALGFKNTHNRFGDINFYEVQKWIDEPIEGVITMKRVCELVEDKKKLNRILEQKAREMIKKWFDIDIEVKIC